MLYIIKNFTRSMKNNIAQILTITIIIATGCSFFVGLTHTYNTLNHSITNYYNKQNLADLSIFDKNFSESDITKIKSIEGIDSVESGTQFTGLVGESELIVNSFNPNNSVNKLELIEGKYPKDEEIAVSKEYLEANNLKVKDRIELKVQDKQMKFTISGIVRSPQYLYLVKDSAQPVPNHKLFGYAFIDINFIEKEVTTAHNTVSLKLTGKESVSTVKDKIHKLKSTYLIVEKKDTQSYAMIKNKVDSLQSMSLVLPIVFVALAVIVTIISMSRQVENQRDQIAIMKALGCSRSIITTNFIFTPLITAVVGVIIGTLLGVNIFPKLLINTLTILFTIPQLEFSNFLNLSLVAFIIILFLEVVAVLFSCNKILKETPAKAMRPKMPKVVKRSFFEKNKTVWSKLSYDNKLVVRNVAMNRKRFLLSSVGVVFSICILISSFGLKFALQNIIETEFSLIRNYDVSAKLSEPQTNFKLSSTNIKNMDFYSVFQIKAKDKDTKLNVVSDDAKTLQLINGQGEQLHFHDLQGIYISEKLAQELNIKRGDVVPITIHIAGLNDVVVNTKIIDYYRSYTSQGIYTTFTFLKNMNEEVKIQNILLNTDKLDDLKYELQQDKRISNITLKHVQKEDYVTAAQSIDKMVAIMIIASAILLFTVIYNIGSINIFERQRDIATEKVLGLHNKEINRLILKENIILIIFSIAIGIILSFNTYSFLSNKLAPEDMDFPKELNYISILLSIVCILLFTVLTNVFLKKKIKKINMLEALKSVE